MLKITPVDSSAEEEGVWTSYMGVKLKIARANNDTYKRVFRKLSKPYQHQIDKKTIDEETASGIVVESVARGLLKDWDEFVVDGKKVDFSISNAIDLLSNDHDCLDFVQNFADDIDNFIQEEIEEASKES